MPTKDVSFSVLVRFLHKVGIDLKSINKKKVWFWDTLYVCISLIGRFNYALYNFLQNTSNLLTRLKVPTYLYKDYKV